MNRNSLWLMALVAILWHMGLVRAAEPMPEAKVLPAVPNTDAGPRLPMPELTGVAYGQDAGPGRAGLVGGAGLYWIQPFFENNPAFTVSVTTPTGPGGTASRVTDRTDIRHHMAVAPQLWLGFLSDAGLGGRVRWWYFRQGTDQSVSVPAGAPGTLALLVSAAPLGFPAFADNEGRPAVLTATSKLELQVRDFEVIHSVQTGSWDLLFAGGLRWVDISQHYNAFVAGDSGGGAGRITASVLSGHSFHGIGPELALEARRSLGDRGLAVYSSARVALLFGSATQSAADIFTNATATFIDAARDHRHRVLPAGELELGLEFSGAMGSSRLFGQIALIGQEWWGAGSASRSIQTNTSGADTTAQGSIVDSDLAFVGLAFRLGVNY